VRPKVNQGAGLLSPPHAVITKAERNKTNIKTDEQIYAHC